VGGGRVAVHEILIGVPAIRNLIRENKVAQMYSMMQTGQKFGMQTLDQALEGFLEKGLITRETAREHATNKDKF
jgi:twitching motility protein PilT